MRVSPLIVLLALLSCFAIGVSALQPPYKVIYIDYLFDTAAPDETVITAASVGYNVVIISFYLSTKGPVDLALNWAALPSSTKQNAIQQIHASGGVVLVSLGGSTDTPYTQNAYNLGAQVAAWAKSNYLDGVDFDLENLSKGFLAGSYTGPETVEWFSNITLGARSVLGSSGIITHAPQAPYFGPIGDSTTWTNVTGGFASINLNVGSAIDFYNVQFYNQGPYCYVDYNGLFVSSGSSCPQFPHTAVNELVGLGIPLNKIVVGKPVVITDAGSGFVNASSLHTFFLQANAQYGWNTGLMGWMWNDTTVLTNWLATIYAPGPSSTTSRTSTTASLTSGAATTGNRTTTGTTTSGSERLATGWYHLFCAVLFSSALLLVLAQ